MRDRKQTRQRLASAFVSEAERIATACPPCAAGMSVEDRQRYLDDARAFRERLTSPDPSLITPG